MASVKALLWLTYRATSDCQHLLCFLFYFLVFLNVFFFDVLTYVLQKDDDGAGSRRISVLTERGGARDDDIRQLVDTIADIDRDVRAMAATLQTNSSPTPHAVPTADTAHRSPPFNDKSNNSVVDGRLRLPPPVPHSHELIQTL